jgi:hypothetical protein
MTSTAEFTFNVGTDGEQLKQWANEIVYGAPPVDASAKEMAVWLYDYYVKDEGDLWS